MDSLEKKVGMNDSEKEKSAINDYVPEYMVPGMVVLIISETIL